MMRICGFFWPISLREREDMLPSSINENRRSYERFQSRFPVKFKDTRDNFGSNVHLRNVSAEGAKITTREQLYLNDSICMEVELPDGKSPMIMRAVVVWTNKLDAQIWDVGIKFHKVVFMNLWRIHKFTEIDPVV